MRDLKECTAEVFRRSEKKIQARRKRRNRVLALSIPVCLIAAAWPVMNIPMSMLAGASGNRAPLAGEAAGNAPGGPVCPYVSVEIRQAGLSPAEPFGKATDPAAVAEMFHAVQSLFSDIDGNGRVDDGNLPAEENTEGHAPAESPNRPEDYTITFTAENGSRAVYRLSGNVLMNVGTGETVCLSDAQAAGLLAVPRQSE